MFLDANGDAQHSAEDRMSKGVPTIINIFLRTDTNRDGTPAVCSYGPNSMYVSSYEILLQAVGGTVEWGPMYNNVGCSGAVFARDASDTTGSVFYHNGYGCSTWWPPGLHLLAVMSATPLTGSPRIDIIPQHPVVGNKRTTFGGSCIANPTYDYTNRLGINWIDVDGLGPPPDAAPRVTAPGMVLPQEGSTVQFDVAASDPDADAILELSADLSELPLAHDAVFTTDPSQTTGTFSWTPTESDSGDYEVTFTARNYVSTSRTTVIHVAGVVAGSEGGAVPAAYRLGPNRPNPFNPGTEIDFTLARQGPVRIMIYDPVGRLIRELFAASLPSGPHSIHWDGLDSQGQPVASGVYWSRLEAGAVRLSRRVTLIR
jgi:hypothetical protein